jgi:tRNA (guanosine-2'-O-)-methyltransferase
MESVMDRRQPDLTVLLENVFDPHNIAAVLRTCDAVGIMEAYAITDRIPHRKAWGFRSSRSASKWVTLHHYENRRQCLEVVRAKYGRLLGAGIGEGGSSLYDVRFSDSLALVFGNEKYGLSEEMMNECDGFFEIPQMGMIHSLNISVACAVTLYEAMRQRMLTGVYDRPSLDSKARQDLFSAWTATGDDAET